MSFSKYLPSVDVNVKDSLKGAIQYSYREDQRGERIISPKIDGEQESVATSGLRKASDRQFQSKILRTRKV